MTRPLSASGHHPDIHHDKLKHCCLYCLVTSSRVVTDSEWHAFCECPGASTARDIFCLSANLEKACSNQGSIHDLCILVRSVADSAVLPGQFARFSYDIRCTRRECFRRSRPTASPAEQLLRHEPLQRKSSDTALQQLYPN